MIEAFLKAFLVYFVLGSGLPLLLIIGMWAGDEL